MFWHHRNHQNATVAAPQLGAREITRFDGTLANDNDASDATQRRPRRSGRALPAVAFFSGLGAAGLILMAERLLGL
jgi:hypothetical protein